MDKALYISLHNILMVNLNIVKVKLTDHDPVAASGWNNEDLLFVNIQ